MSGAADYIPLLWASVAGAGLLAYVLMDGWVLGVGILYPLVGRETDRDLLIASLAPSWAANEIWLVLGAVLLLLGFPAAYSFLLLQLYLPVVAMLVLLVLRGMGYEFLRRGYPFRPIWKLTFAGGSILAALAQGYIAGRLIEGFGGSGVTSGLLGWLNALIPIFCSLGQLGACGLLGACWLIFETDGALRVMGREVAHSTLILTAAVMLAMCLVTPMVSPHVAHRWSEPPVRTALVLFVATAALVIWRLWVSLWRNADHRPLQWAAALLSIAVAGVFISLYPYIVPYQLTLYELANDPSFFRLASVSFLLVVPVGLLYLLLNRRTHRRKTRPAANLAPTSPALASRKTCGHDVDLHLS